MNAARFFRTPKGLLILLLGVLLAAAAAGTGVALVAPGVVAAIATAMLIDAPLIRWRRGRWHVPDGALLTGLIVAMILSPHQPWYVAAVTSAIAVLSKYPLRARTANIFNPAAFALVASFYLFHTGQSWWGALPELSPFALALLIATGAFITHRVNKVHAVLAFLGSYYTLITLAAFVGNPAHVAELYRAPDLHAALFFAFFMVTDPPTSPPKHRDQLIYGGIVGVTSYAMYALVGAVYFLLAGLLVANVWEAWRRNATARRPTAAHARGGLVVALLAALSFTAGCHRATSAARTALESSGALAGVWDLVSVRTRWPDGRVTEPWGAAPVGSLTYGPDGRMITLLMDARRNQADGRAVPADMQASVAAYYGTYTVDPVRRVVTHHVATSLRASEAGSIERGYTLDGDTLVLVANALYEGAAVTHTLVWHRAAGGGH